MNKLPTIKFIDPPLWQRNRLLKWLEEWRLYKALQRSEFAEPGDLESNDLTSLQKMVRPIGAGRAVRAGDIRLLSSALLPEAERPVYVAVLSDWERGCKLIAPFAPLGEPATPGEILTCREEPSLQVLSLWNARSISVAKLKKSWFVDRMKATEKKEAWAVFKHVLTGCALPPALTERVGPPVSHPADPRIKYQSEEAALLAPLVGEEALAPATDMLSEQIGAVWGK